MFVFDRVLGKDFKMYDGGRIFVFVRVVWGDC